MDQIPLSDVLVGLRAELLKAQKQAKKQKLQFKLEDIEVELKVGTTKEGGGEGGLNFSVIGLGAELGAEGSIAAERLQTVRLKLTPLAEGGVDTLISDRQKK
jgi:hypothetical protein